MIDRNHDFPVTRQAKVLNIRRGSVYYRPRPVSAGDLAIMRRIDELHLDCPFAGSRMLRDMLRREGFVIGRCHVATLMKRMGIEAIYRRPNTSKPAPGHKIYLDFYNRHRPHSSLDRRTPDEATLTGRLPMRLFCHSSERGSIVTY